MISPQEILNASILIVDDQQTNIQLLTEMLRDSGYVSITSTNDPYQACPLYQKNRHDLILLDLQMPDMDGFQVMEELKAIEQESYVPILVITAQPAHKLRALQAGAKDFVSKPFDMIEVQTRIHNMLEVRLLHKKLDNYNKELEQKVQERTAELHESEARFRRLTELSSDWYWEQDENGGFTKIFGPVLEMLGLQADGTRDRSMDDQATRWNKDERETLEASLTAKRTFLDFIYSLNHADGTRQYLMVSGEPMFDSSGRFTGYRGIGKDVTETMSATETA